jgi:hypothetical protein
VKLGKQQNKTKRNLTYFKIDALDKH